MGRVYLPPQVLVAVSVVAAIAALLIMAARPAEGRGDPPAEPRPARPAAGPVSPAAGGVLAAQVESPPAREPAVRERDPAREVVRPAAGTTVVVRSRPRGPVVARLGARTEFGSPRTLLVAKRRGPWLGVVTTHVANGRLGWVDARAADLRSAWTRVRVLIDLSARRLVVRDGDRALFRMTVGVGRATSPTPLGRFAVTDKLSGARYGPYYGCCILALSAHQPRLPAGWRGGDRIAVHGTNDPASVGAAVSAGCPRGRDADLQRLLRLVPLGAPVVVRA